MHLWGWKGNNTLLCFVNALVRVNAALSAAQSPKYPIHSCKEYSSKILFFNYFFTKYSSKFFQSTLSTFSQYLISCNIKATITPPGSDKWRFEGVGGKQFLWLSATPKLGPEELLEQNLYWITVLRWGVNSFFGSQPLPNWGQRNFWSEIIFSRHFSWSSALKPVLERFPYASNFLSSSLEYITQ